MVIVFLFHNRRKALRAKTINHPVSRRRRLPPLQWRGIFMGNSYRVSYLLARLNVRRLRCASPTVMHDFVLAGRMPTLQGAKNIFLFFRRKICGNAYDLDKDRDH
jgi:hypothetical protein